MLGIRCGASLQVGEGWRKLNIIADYFCGGGGASTGIHAALGRSPTYAVNHNPDALAMHEANHPDTIHLREDVFKVDTRHYVEGKTFDTVTIWRAYMSRKDKAPIVFPWTGYEVRNITHPHFKNIPTKVFAIKLEKP